MLSLLSTRTLKVFFCKAAVHLVRPQPVLVYMVSSLQDLPFPVAELHETPLCPFLWSIRVPLNGVQLPGASTW